MQEHFREKEDEQQSSSDERIRVTSERYVWRPHSRPAGQGFADSGAPLYEGCQSSFKYALRVLMFYLNFKF